MKVGVFIAPNGLTDEFKSALAQRKTTQYLIVTIDQADIERWIDADDRISVLNDLHERAVLAWCPWPIGRVGGAAEAP